VLGRRGRAGMARWQAGAGEREKEMDWRRLGQNDFQAKRGFGLRNYFSDLNKVLSSQNKGLKLFQIDFELYSN
jgi:hypothetical protein